jgi:hypothetical protein
MVSGSQVWDEIFIRHNLKERVAADGVFFFTSKELNQISNPLGGPDARNLVKYDHRSQLPNSLRRNNLSILPIARGEFAIGNFDIYAPLGEDSSPPLVRYSIPSHLETLKKLRSETDSLIVAHHSGAISDLVGEQAAFVGGGKDSGPGFEMSVSSKGAHEQETLYVKKGVTIEIDGLFESKSCVLAVEAKMKTAIDFNIRQLYYPFRALSERHKKSIRTIYLSFTNGIFDAREFVFLEPESISSYQEIKRSRFALSDDEISRSEIEELAVRKAPIEIGHGFPVPQADSLERVIDLAQRLTEAPMTKAEISNTYGFHSRQSDYYANAAGFLGLARRNGPSSWETTELAQTIFSLGFKERNLALMQVILAQATVRLGYKHFLETNQVPDKNQSLAIISESEDLTKISGSTIPRRVSTLRGWVRWLSSMEMRGH